MTVFLKRVWGFDPELPVLFSKPWLAAELAELFRPGDRVLFVGSHRAIRAADKGRLLGWATVEKRSSPTEVITKAAPLPPHLYEGGRLLFPAAVPIENAVRFADDAPRAHQRDVLPSTTGRNPYPHSINGRAVPLTELHEANVRRYLG